MSAILAHPGFPWVGDEQCVDVERFFMVVIPEMFNPESR
jgi:hypothetical protein